VSQRGWKTWAYLPDELLTYDGAEPVEKPVDKSYKLGERLLKRTSPIMTGADVSDLQKRLNALGHDCGAVDGEYGKATETGVKAFQAASDIEVDGKFGPASLAALKASESLRTKGVEEVAREVIAGKWGNGADRKKNLEAAGYNYKEVQQKVNDLL
jgi:peptidoglycan hydrolase-like protein with peptidoglycan-binding domain